MSYTAAVTHPFEPEAEGAQVPDMYTFPTQTSVVRTAFNIQLAAGQSNVDFVLQPNPFCTIAASSPYGISNQIQGGVAWSNESFPFQNAPGVNGFMEYGLVSPDTLSQTYARYRIVGWGARVRCTLAPLNQSGEIAMVKVPSLSHWMNWPLIAAGGPLQGSSGLPSDTAWSQPPASSSAANQYVSGMFYPLNGSAGFGPTWSDYLGYYGLPGVDVSGYVTTAILAAPLAHHMNVAQLTMDSGVEVSGKIASPDAYKWRDASNAVGYFESLANGPNFKGNICSASQFLVQTNSGVTSPTFQFDNQIVGINDEDFVQQGGWSVLVFRASGLPVSDVSTTVFTVDVIMHLEGVPQFTSAPAISGAKYPFYHPRALEAVQAVSSSMPAFRKPGHKHRRKGFMAVLDAVSREVSGRSIRGNLHHGVSAATQMAREAIGSFEENPELAAGLML